VERLRRKRHTAWEIAEKLRMAVSTVSALLKRLGLGRLSFLEPKPVIRRYERQRAGELLHIDTKKLAKIQGVGHRIHGDRRRNNRGRGWEFVHVCVDDASRAAYIEVHPDEKKESVVPFLERAIAWFAGHGVAVERVLTDNGSAYRSELHRASCEAQGIRHLRTRPYTPRTNGKAERFIQTLLRRCAYARPYQTSAARTRALHRWIIEYNHRRPHHGIGRQTPMNRLEAVR
jgi:transposase InsO family protein